MTLSLVEMPMGATGYVNQTNQFIFVYGTATVTLTDSSGNTVKVASCPTWVPPGWTINTGTSTDILLGLSGNLPDFAGFLSKTAPAGPTFSSSLLGATVGLATKSAATFESETFHGGSPQASYAEQESEAVTHVP